MKKLTACLSIANCAFLGSVIFAVIIIIIIAKYFFAVAVISAAIVRIKISSSSLGHHVIRQQLLWVPLKAFRTLRILLLSEVKIWVQARIEWHRVGIKAPHSWSDEVKGPTKGGGGRSFLVQKLSNYAKRIHEPKRSMAWICCRSPILLFHTCFGIRITGSETCQIMQSQARLAPRVKAGNS